MEELDEEMLEFERRYGKQDEGKGRGNRGGNGGNGGGGSMKTLSIVLGVVAAALLAVLAVMFINKKKLVDELNDEKAELATELNALQQDYSELSSTNQAINDSLAVEKEKVGQLIENLQRTEATNRAKIRQYEKEIGTLRTIMKSYISQIDSLNTLNTSLRHEAADARKDAAESRERYEKLVTTTEEYAAKASAGAVVKGRGVSVTAINASNKATDRSSRVVKLKTCLSLIENSIASKGPRRVYIVVSGPDGSLMTGEQSTSFTCGGQSMMCTASREVDYQGDEVEVCIYYANPDAFVKGIYTVDVYSGEVKLGSADLVLK